MSNKRSAATRRAQLAARSTETRAAAGVVRPELGDPSIGLTVHQIRPGGGRERTQVRWTVDPDPGLALLGVTRLRGLLAGIEAEAVAEMRAQGAPWADIGLALGVSGQAAGQRFSS